MIDRYTKIVLTVIAVALSALAVQGFIPTAQAAPGDGACGANKFTPCSVSIVNETVPVTPKDKADFCGDTLRPCAFKLTNEVVTVAQKDVFTVTTKDKTEACGVKNRPCYVQGGSGGQYKSVGFDDSYPLDVKIVGSAP
jgi:hypothetical protein